MLLPVSLHVRALSARRALFCPFAPTTPRPSPRPSLKTPPRPLSLARCVSPLSGGFGHADLLGFPALPTAQPTPRVSFRAGSPSGFAQTPLAFPAVLSLTSPHSPLQVERQQGIEAVFIALFNSKFPAMMSPRDRPSDPFSRLRFALETMPGSRKYVFTPATRAEILSVRCLLGPIRPHVFAPQLESPHACHSQTGAG